MAWWLWTIGGCVLLALELIGPGFFVLFFGIGALLVAGATALWPGLALWVQLALFSVSSVGTLLLFRKRLTEAFSPERPSTTHDILRDIAVPLADLDPGAVGKVELRGVPWSARNVSATPLRRGQRCRVVEAKDLMLLIVAE